ncbi:MAG TPA: ABC transporter ATP-binding protein [Methanosarcinaceae archaeon]|nr:ABC transporter ATP-binding protein [Methanosarcinaceae archaeon]
MNLLEIINLTTHFQTPDGIVQAVDKIDLSIREKETFGLIGETGCGKTVIGLTIMRLLPPTATVGGEILYNGKNLLEVSETGMRKIRGEEIAIILQNPTTSLNPVLKVGEQIAEAIRLHQGLNKHDAKKKAIEMLDSVRISSPSRRANEYPHKFSGGMKQRVMIAMGLACDPSFIIADEPTKGLDVTIKAQIVELMKEMTEHKAMLLITHDLGVAAEMCDRIALMYAGELVEYAPLDEIFEKPLHPYTIGFLNSLPKKGLVPIPGMSPSLINFPDGCRFHSRCDYATGECKQKHPDMVEMGNGHFVRCFHARS